MMNPLLQRGREAAKRFNAKRQSRKVAKPVLPVQSATRDGYQPIASANLPKAPSPGGAATSDSDQQGTRRRIGEGVGGEAPSLPLCETSLRDCRFALKIPSAPPRSLLLPYAP